MHVSLRIAMALVVGILLADVWVLGTFFLWAALPAIAVLESLQLPSLAARRLVIVLLIGGFVFSANKSCHDQVETSYQQLLDDRQSDTLHGTVVGLPQRWPGRQEVLLEVASAAGVQDAQAVISLSIYDDEDSAVADLLPGQELQIYARLRSPVGLRAPGASDRRRQIWAKGADLVGTASLADLELGERQWSWWLVPTKMHRWALATTREAGESLSCADCDDGLAIVNALTTGDRGDMDRKLSQSLRTAGIAHLLAVSGMHLATVVLIVFFLSSRLWSRLPWSQIVEPRTMAAGLSLVAAILFTAMTGARPATCRALLVASIVLVGMILDRRLLLLHALAWAAVTLLLWRPVLLWDPGFQMSFAATIALALAFRHSTTHDHIDEKQTPESKSKFAVIAQSGKRIARGIYAILRASFWATLATAPIAMHHFGFVSPFALLSNLVAVPLTTMVLLPLSLAGLVLSRISMDLGQPLLHVAITIANSMANVSHWIDSLTPMVFRAPLNLLELSAWALITAALLFRRHLARRLWLPLLLIGLTVIGLSRWQWNPRQGIDTMRVTFVEIGQGDATLIELPGGETWLVDGGGLPFSRGETAEDRRWMGQTPARRSLLPLLRERRIEHIDLVIVSHPHPDHYVGLQAVAKRMHIRELWSAHELRTQDGVKVAGPYEQWLATLESRGTLVTRPTLSRVRESGGATLRVLWPRYENEAAPDPILSVNDNSLVVRIDFAGRRFLFTGDVEEEAEELLVAAHADALRADVVKVPHHGSPTSSSVNFVKTTEASIAVISCGRANHFGFPGPKVEKRWHEQTALVLRTDLVGSIVIEVSQDGQLHVVTMSPFR